MGYSRGFPVADDQADLAERNALDAQLAAEMWQQWADGGHASLLDGRVVDPQARQHMTTAQAARMQAAARDAFAPDADDAAPRIRRRLRRDSYVAGPPEPTGPLVHPEHVAIAAIWLGAVGLAVWRLMK
ncbi:hypothetical protein GTZ99_01935 [Novosphingobium sp. FSY-8]|uniref:Uncharacterized protein n=1 Tax=Novosphingobium ovatum TaxID=1908523 RepID=A0ABW9X9W7_9SPHN|nr:hypothetical protein [Novosphingobium ovatum]NBC35315.1 hypothetical protein [Novosphingobium ovatum]